MRRRALVFGMILGVAVVLGVSIAVLQRGRASILANFQSSQGRLTQFATDGLQGYLDSFDRDTRLAATLAKHTRSQVGIDASIQDEVIQAAFVAQVTVVAHYRTIALFASSGRDPIVAVDPTEDPSRIAPALVAASAAVAHEAIRLGRTSLVGPLAIGDDRFFYLCASPAGQDEAVVVSADASLMFEVAGRSRGGSQIMVVVDPSGATWLGCENRQSCRLFSPGSDGQRKIQALLLATSSTAVEPNSAREPSLLPLPARVVIGTAAPARTPLGLWSVALMAPATEPDARERNLLLQLMLTSTGFIVIILAVGFFIARQRSTAAALEIRLQAAEDIANLRERGERLLENVPAGILGVTREGRLAIVNRFFLERIQPNADSNKAAFPPWTQRLRPHIDRALASKRTQIVTDRDVGLGQPELRDYDLRIIPLDRPAEDVAALVLVEDLSEVHNLQRQLVRAEKLVTVGVLSAGIAHEVGTPLMVIRGCAEHLLDSAKDSATGEDLRSIIDQIDHISDTIRQVLEFCRSEQPLEIGTADARICVARAVKLLEWRLASKQVTVRQDVADGLPFIHADPTQFEQMVVNLLMNACDASPGGAAIDVVGKLDSPYSDRLRLEVTDHGSGIAREHMNAVFDPYFTTKKRGEGTGLGLAIVAHIVRLHHGEVTLASEPGAGTTATVLWPLVPQTPAASA
jgi:two-component system sensor histidine kinase HydH